MNSVWVLVCDAARGRVFSVNADGSPWHLVESFRHDEARSKVSDLMSDREGRSSPRGHSTHHNALAPASSLKEREERHFVQELAKFLEREALSHRFHKWVLVAPPHMLGMIKATIASELAKRLMATVDKDLTEFAPSDLALRLHEAIRIPPDQLEVLNGPVKRRH